MCAIGLANAHVARRKQLSCLAIRRNRSHALSMASSGPKSASRWSFPTTIKTDSGRPLLRSNSRLSSNGDRKFNHMRPSMKRVWSIQMRLISMDSARASPFRAGTACLLILGLAHTQS